MVPYFQITIPSYAALATIGLIVAVLYLYANINQVELSFREFLIYLVTGMIFLFIGSRIIFVISSIPDMKPVTVEKIADKLFNGGIVFYGGLLGLIVGVNVTSKLLKKNTRTIFNYFAVSFPLFHAFARIGCLLAGCCYGKESSWGVVMASDNVVRLPIQLFEAICNIIIFVTLLILKKRRDSINILKVYLCLYAVCRFILEFFRGDVVRGLWMFGLSTSQLISIGIFAYYMVQTVFEIRKGTVEGKVDDVVAEED